MEQVEKDLLLLLRNARSRDEYYRFLIAKYAMIARQKLVETVVRDYKNNNLGARRYEELLGVPPSKSMSQERSKLKEFKMPFFPNESTKFVAKAFEHILSKDSDLKGESS